MDAPAALLVVHAACTWAMTGLIWFVQVVHYPLFATVGADAFPAYHAAHTRLTTLVVAPLMVVEAIAAVWIAVARADDPGIVWSGLALVGVVWLATFGLSVPRHDALMRGGYDVSVIAGLVATNWVRTVAWTLRAGLAAWMLRGVVRA
ncbi:MAG: hypothetical protein U0P30_14265 [Vicinamibacterales bacterium]